MKLGGGRESTERVQPLSAQTVGAVSFFTSEGAFLLNKMVMHVDL